MTRWPAFGRRRWALVVLAGALALSVISAAWVFWKASRTLQDAAEEVAGESRIAFTAAYLDQSVPAGFESIASPALFRDAAIFDGRFYVCGPGGLNAYSLDGAPLANYRAGLELPAAPLVAMAPGLAAGAGGPELWIATQGAGLLEFDGRRFRQLKPAAPSQRKLTSVLPLASGRILLGTETSGVLVYDGRTLAPFHPELATLRVTALAGTEANVWIGTLDQGVYHWLAGEADHFGEAEGLPDKQVLSLAVDSERAFVGTALGVAEFQSGRFVRRLGAGIFAKALAIRGDRLETGTLEEGVVSIPLGTGRPRTGATAAPIERLVRAGDKFYALAEDGLYALDGWRRVLGRPGALLKDRNISALATDSSGRLWIGYFDHGLQILEPGGERSSSIEDEHVYCVNRIVHSRERAVTAVATANGLVMFDSAGKERQVLGKSSGLIADHVTDVVFRPGDGALAMTVATPAGLTMIDDSGVSSLYAFHGLVNNHVYALASAGSKMMAGTLGGLSVLEAGIVRASFTTANSGLRQNWITAIAPVGDDFFVGTYGAGIFQMDRAGSWQSFGDLPRAFEVNPNALAVTKNAVYAGTLGRGLAVYNRALGRWSMVVAGLPSLNVTAIDVSGGLVCIGTENGLVRVPERNLLP